MIITRPSAKTFISLVAGNCEGNVADVIIVVTSDANENRRIDFGGHLHGDTLNLGRERIEKNDGCQIA